MRHIFARLRMLQCYLDGLAAVGSALGASLGSRGRRIQCVHLVCECRAATAGIRTVQTADALAGWMVHLALWTSRFGFP
jgi:hypothetical protein